MQINEYLTMFSLVLTPTIAILVLGLKGIQAWKEAEKTKNREHIEAIVDLRFETKLNEMKKNYSEVISLIKSGTFK